MSRLRCRLYFSSKNMYDLGDMKKIFEQIKKHWKINLITFFVSLLLGGGIFCLIFFLRNMTIIAAVDGAAIGSVVVIFLGLLMLVHFLGAFDTFAFGFKQLGTMIFSKDPRKDNSYQEYREDKILKRANSSYNFVIVILTGSLLSISIIVLEIIYRTSIY